MKTLCASCLNVQAQAVRSQARHQDPKASLRAIQQAIQWEKGAGFVNCVGEKCVFADFLCEQLNDVQLPLPAQQARYFASLKHSATNYDAWDVQQRQQFCSTLLKVLASYSPGPRQHARQRVMHGGRSHPVPMGTTTRVSPPLSNGNMGQGQPALRHSTPRQYTYTDGVPPQTPMSQQPPVHHDTITSSVPAARQDTAMSQASASGSHTQTASPQQLMSASAQTTASVDTIKQQPGRQRQALSIDLSAEVKAFLEKPVSGPYRPIIFDLETTGGLDAAHRILELAAIGQHSGNQYASLVNTYPVRSSPGALQCHHIADAEAHHPSVPKFGEVASRFLELVMQECSGPEGGIPVLVAHNGVRFDFKFVTMELQRWGLELPADWCYLDTLTLAKQALRDKPGEKAISRSQNALRERYGIPANNAHRALDDTIILQQILPCLLQDSGKLDMSELMKMGTKSTGTFADLVGPAPKVKKAAAAKREDTEQTLASLVEEEESYASEPDPVSISPPLLPQLTPADAAKLKKVKAHWREDVVGNDGVNRGLLDLPPEKVKALTPAQRRDLSKAGFETFWEVLQYYPKEYIYHHTHLQNDSHVIVPGTVIKSYGANRSLFITIQVDDTPLPSANTSSPAGPDQSQQSEDSSSMLEDADSADSTSTAHSDSDAGSELLLNEHGRSVEPEEASTSTPGAAPSASQRHAATAARGPQTVHVKKFIPNQRACWSVTKQYSAGTQVMLQGRVTQASKPGEWEAASDAELSMRDPDEPLPKPQLLPRYSQRAPISNKTWPAIMQRALSAVQQDPSLQTYDVIPAELSEQYDLIGWQQALAHMHKPVDDDNLKAAKHRMAFEELFLLQLKLLLRREVDRAPRNEDDIKGISISQLDMMHAGSNALGFTLTPAQDRVLSEILADMKGPAPMVRLLQGDVGSGKTAVAFLALLAAVGSGWQGAMMAPTEVLAEQHILKLERLVASMPEDQRPTIALLTGSAKAKERRAVYAGLADGSIQLVMGTHALITDALEFKHLGLAVIDEQHRFGVQQRAKLQSKNHPLPHLLSMTATPIPRTLALTVHGDMALSAIDQLPPGRQPVQTVAFQDNATNRKQMYTDIQKELAEGGRAYFVYPLVEESTSEIMASVKAAEEEHRKLLQTKVLGDYKCGLLHGRMSSEHKAAALQAFATGDTPVLLSTTVIEVGVDVPEATIMVVEHSDRFGLAQLHQLRGRVGRGLRASKCYLVTPSANALTRLQVLTKSQNGFIIAEADLQDRGPGDFLGKKQSGVNGLGYLKAARLPQDRQILEQARAGAADMLQESGLEPSAWPQNLLAALKDRGLPDIDLAELPAGSGWGNQ